MLVSGTYWDCPTAQRASLSSHLCSKPVLVIAFLGNGVVQSPFQSACFLSSGDFRDAAKAALFWPKHSFQLEQRLGPETYTPRSLHPNLMI